jgi:hypothetical protein
MGRGPARSSKGLECFHRDLGVFEDFVEHAFGHVFAPMDWHRGPAAIGVRIDCMAPALSDELGP